MLAPIVVFAFNRPNALNNLLTSLKRKKTFANKSFTERITTSNNRTFFITMYFDL